MHRVAERRDAPRRDALRRGASLARGESNSKGKNPAPDGVSGAHASARDGHVRHVSAPGKASAETRVNPLDTCRHFAASNFHCVVKPFAVRPTRRIRFQNVECGKALVRPAYISGSCLPQGFHIPNASHRGAGALPPCHPKNHRPNPIRPARITGRRLCLTAISRAPNSPRNSIVARGLSKGGNAFAEGRP